MSYDRPSPPADLSTAEVDRLEEYSADALRDIANYADALAEYKERELEDEEDETEPAGDDQPDDRPEDVPGKATVTVKEINDNRYYYWQWRDGDKIRSKYKGPVDPAE